MGWQLIFAPQALDDLAEAVRDIAMDNPEAAERIGNALIDRVQILTRFPRLGRIFAKRKGVRTLVSAPYVIFYRVMEEEQRVEIMRYWHAARGDAELE